MDITKYLTVLLVLCLKGGETGGGGKHHDHVKLHIPEFHHHDHHKKVITIHHHHHPPKKEHHHHHHHHHKPSIPHGHHYSHHHKKVHLKTHTVSKGGNHGSHGHVGHGHKHNHHPAHHSNHGYHGYQGHHRPHHSHPHGDHDYPGYGYSYEAPVVSTVSYTPNAIPTYDDDFTPSIPSYDSGISITSFSKPTVPQVRGVSHTVKHVKVFDSLPGALPKKLPANGYEVTEEGEEGEEAFLTINNLQNTYPATFGYVRAVASEPTNEPFSVTTSQGSVPQTHDPFASAPAPTLSAIETFTGTTSSEPYPSSIPTQTLVIPSQVPSVDYPTNFQETAFDAPENSFTGTGVDGPSFISDEENSIDDTPVTFTRAAGIQQTTKTGNVETLVY